MLFQRPDTSHCLTLSHSALYSSSRAHITDFFPAGAQGSVKVAAPMPGTILSVKVSVGQQVKKGDTVAVLEAMKMENEIPAPQDGTVSSVDVSNGATVETGATIVTLA